MAGKKNSCHRSGLSFVISTGKVGDSRAGRASCLDVHLGEEPVYSHQQQVEKVYGGALHNPVDPIGSVAGITPIKNYEDLDEKVWIRDLDPIKNRSRSQ